MPVIDDFLVMCANGPVEVGLNAHADRLQDTSDYLYYPIAADAELTLSSIGFKEGTSAAARRVVHAMAGMLCSETFQTAVDMTCTTRNHPTISGDSPDVLTRADLENAILMIYACKLNWWQMNHHTGTSSTHAAGFCAKAMTALGIDPTNPSNVHAVWMGTHWFDTKVILRALSVLPGGAPEGWPKATHEIAMRVSSNPAGTALAVDCALVVSHLRSSMYADAIPTPVLRWHEGMLLDIQTMSKNPARYHMGARHLTGQDRRIFAQPPDEVMSIVGSALQVVYPGTSISKSNALRACPNSGEYTAIFGGIKRVISSLGESYGAQLMERAKERRGLTASDWAGVRCQFDTAEGDSARFIKDMVEKAKNAEAQHDQA